MKVFNSLGSNYSWSFVWQNMSSLGSHQTSAALKQILGKYYGGEVSLTYKGREALELAMRLSGLPEGSAVAINGFTCYVVYQAIERAGYTPVFVDVAERQLHFGPNELKAMHQKTAKLRAVVVQNSLGFPIDMTAIEKYAHEQKLLLIEDLAHSQGTLYADGREAGTVGDFTMLSFSQDKPLDVVAGGALIDRRHVSAEAEQRLPRISPWQRLKNRFYPFWTGLIRASYPIGIGRYLHFVLKRLHWLSTPMSDGLEGLHDMSPAAARMILRRWGERESALAHRRQIAMIYDEQLSPELILGRGGIGQPSYLRYPLWVEKRSSLVNYLRQFQIYIGDTWYDAPIAPSRYLKKTNYQSGECPHGEALAAHILNLPTHRAVTPEIAEYICAKIRQWQAVAPKT